MSGDEVPVASSFDWRDDMPDQCPPNQAHFGDGSEFFRFISKGDEKDPVCKKDFVLPRDIPRKEPIPDDKLCSFSALSVFKDAGDLELMRDFVPGFRKKRVAKGGISPQHGLIINSPQPAGKSEHIMLSHYDWWVPLDVFPERFFEVVAI
ncbi:MULTISPECIES: hypothetical protein [unclassified Amycolatopsis]|uniref:hypothetical protein n=1 Tax=unclassified Amycolatopsis TaxID=2618356 RepID=UPI002876984B|nr:MULTISPECIES: hypothetical protein [unclassified Amycolatopsis]MDS0135763.1 hypothetical protein [Amycolatopsis sp. 505]MDS0145636.1 hypothetical protein [Amycolatopsis sp. CM201R]